MRRRGRVCALQILYQMDLAKELDAGTEDSEAYSAMRRYWGSFEPVGVEDREFCERLVLGVVRELTAIDEALAQASHHWKLPRMDKVDRNLLRVAAYEMLRCKDVPRAVSINEAIEIAKRFSGNESAAFINGILDQLAKDGAPASAPTGDAAEGAKVEPS